MKIAIIQNGAVVSVGEHRDLFPNTSFAGDIPANDWLTENSCMPVIDVKPFNVRLEKLEVVEPYIEGNSVFTVSVQQQTQDELITSAEAKASMTRAERNKKLSATDWTQINDAPVDKSAWAAYRQSLRDVPSQAGFPWDVTWPVEP